MFPKAVHNQPNDYYILLKNNGGDTLEFIDQSTFCKLTGNYEDHMKRKVGGSFRHINTDPGHPYYVYHEGTELHEFYQEYKNVPSPYLYIDHCARKSKSTTPYYHAAFFLFGDSNGAYGLDDTVVSGQPYENKGMDIGVLCPPNCSTTPRQSCN